MFRKVLFLLMALLTVPSFASAYNYWSITASTSPANIAGAITAPTAPANTFVTSGSLTNVISSTQTTATFTVQQSRAGLSLAYVTIDGVKQMAGAVPDLSGSYTVNKGTRIGHSLQAVYASAQYTISTSKLGTGSGIIDGSAKVTSGASKVIKVTAAAGNTFTVAFSGMTPVLTAGDGVNYGEYTYTNVNQNCTIAATFTTTAVATAKIATPPQTIALGDVVALDGTTSYASVDATYTWNVTKNGVAVNGAVAKILDVNGKDTHTANFTAPASGIYDITLTIAAGAASNTSAPIAINVASQAAVASAACTTCHNDKNPKLVSDYQRSADNDVNSCQSCHNDGHGGKVSEARVKFEGSYHWNNHLEKGPEFTDPVTGINGVLNANESYTTLEDGAAVTCSYKCHFKNIRQTNTSGCNACHGNGLLSTGYFANASSSHRDRKAVSYLNTCVYCHSGSKHGKVPNEFWGSKHWQNNFEYGAEFANQTDTTVAGANVTNLGTKTDGYLNANDSYTTTEDGATVTCAYRCHFRPGMGPNANVTGYLADRHATTYVAYSSRATGTKVVYRRPGGDACMACHDPHGLEASARSTCYTCHAGGNHGWSVRAFEKSTHNTGEYAKADGMGGPNGEACVACHNAHSLEAAFFVISSPSTTVVKKALGCQKCHTPGAFYGVYNATADGFKAPHGGGVATNSVGGNGTTQYMTQGATCSDCHSHNNSINAGFAEGGHGAVSSDPMNPWGHYDWKLRTNDGTRQNGNCGRCHTAYGFMKFANATTGMTRLRLVTGQANNVLICVACHNNVDKGTLRTAAAPAGNNALGTGAGQALTSGYFALFSSSASVVAADKTKIQIAFPGYKNSSICVPCHAGRSTAAVFTAIIDQASAAGKNYSTIGTSYYQHAKNVGQTFISQGAYDLNNSLTNFAVTAHAGVKMGASDTQGPCVGCHYSFTDKTHSLEINAASPTCIASSCHAAAPDLVNTKANFDAGVAALDNLIRAKFNPLRVNQSAPLETERANVRFGRFGKAAGVAADATTAKKAYGAWYNWQILATYDNAAWAHNPRFARQILNDTILYLAADGVIPGSGSAQRTLVSNAIATYSANEASAFSAKVFITAPGCGACHSDKVNEYTQNGTYHFASRKNNCNYCHTEQHMTTDAAQAPTCRCHGDSATAQPVLNSLKDAKTAAVCADCHTTAGAHNMGAGNQAILTKKCVECHDVAIIEHEGKVGDNAGVRSIMGEFKKRSHHITGGTPTDAQCAVCHLEGKAVDGKVVVDTAYHMLDNKIYLRDVDNAAGVFAWDGSNHGDMDNFCFACHDADGAKDVATIKALLPAATDKNPFADTLTNGYDQVARAGVVDVKTAFATTNASHHAVIAPKYTYRFSTRANADAWAARNNLPAGTVPDSQIAEGKTVDGEVVEFGNEPVDNATYFLGHGEAEATLYEAGKFVSTYIPLGASEAVADNSQLHCGDCHTVGQWKKESSTNADGTVTPVAIGAHGSANEYLLRNSLGTDALHTPKTLVCFNCHKTTFSVNPVTNYSQVTGYATAHSVSAFHGQCIADSALQIGVDNRLKYSERVDRQATWSTANGSASSNADSGNITGISCTNCHNSGLRKGWGGIHGGNETYTDGLGRSQQTYRFMPGMGNYRYAPPGGWDGKDHTDASLETVSMSGVGAGKAMGGCYTNSALTGSDPNTGYGACSHHGTSTAEKSAEYMARIRVVAPNARTQYGGGTASTPTASEPTVREATGGTSLVTRPLKY